MDSRRQPNNLRHSPSPPLRRREIPAHGHNHKVSVSRYCVLTWMVLPPSTQRSETRFLLSALRSGVHVHMLSVHSTYMVLTHHYRQLYQQPGSSGAHSTQPGRFTSTQRRTDHTTISACTQSVRCRRTSFNQPELRWIPRSSSYKHRLLSES